MIREYAVLLVRKGGTNVSPFSFPDLSQHDKNKIGVFAREAKHVILYIPQEIIEKFRTDELDYLDTVVERYLKRQDQLEPNWEVHHITPIVD